MFDNNKFNKKGELQLSNIFSNVNLFLFFYNKILF